MKEQWNWMQKKEPRLRYTRNVWTYACTDIFICILVKSTLGISFALEIVYGKSVIKLKLWRGIMQSTWARDNIKLLLFAFANGHDWVADCVYGHSKSSSACHTRYQIRIGEAVCKLCHEQWNSYIYMLRLCALFVRIAMAKAHAFSSIFKRQMQMHKLNHSSLVIELILQIGCSLNHWIYSHYHSFHVFFSLQCFLRMPAINATMSTILVQSFHFSLWLSLRLFMRISPNSPQWCFTRKTICKWS